MRAQAGQSTVEYGALLLIALVLFAVAALAVTGTGITDTVLAQIRRALCVATGRGCDSLALAPCVTSSRSKLSDASAHVGVVRFSGSSFALREHRSDGTVVVTLISRSGIGLQGSVGASLGIGRFSLGASLGGIVEGGLGRGRVWRLDSEAKADELMRSLSAEVARRNPRAAGALARTLRGIPHPPPPDEMLGDHGLSAAVSAELGRLGVDLEAQDLAGARTDAATGVRTLTLRRRNTLEVSASVLVAGALARGRHEERYALRVDRAGRPLELVAVELLGLDAGVRLPRPLRVMLAGKLLPARNGHLTVLERRLDLTDTANLAAARGFIRALRDPGLRGADAAAISGALRDRLETAGSARALVYDVGVRVRDLHADGSLGVGIGGAAGSTEETLRLVAASAHEPGEPWRERGDCLNRS